MIFGPPRKLNTLNINIQIEGKTLEIVKTTKFLGLILDWGLTWKSHIHLLTTKIAKSIGIISLAKQTLTKKSLIQLYNAFIFHYLSYCTVIWGKNFDSTLWPVLRLQKISLRIIGNIPRRESSALFCKNHKILKLPEIYTLSVSIFMFNYTNALLPETFKYLFKENNHFHPYKTRNCNKHRPPRTKTKISDNFISNQGANTWNLLNEKFDVNTSLSVFKQNVTKWLLSSY